MRGLTFCDGYATIPIRSKAVRTSTQTLEDVVEWDGTTYSGASPGLPSKYSGEAFPVVGYGTDYPFGLDLETAVKLYMRPKIMRFTVGGLSAFSASGGGGATGTFPAASVYIECDASEEIDPPEFSRVQDQRDLVPGPGSRFIFEIPENDAPPETISEFIDDRTLDSPGGIVRGIASCDRISVCSQALIYKVGGLYYPQMRFGWHIDLLAGRTIDPEEEGDEGGGATLAIRSTNRALPTEEGASFVGVACTIFGEDRELTLRCETISTLTGTGASITGGAGDITLDIGVPPDSGGWLTYGGIYDEDTGAKV